MAGDERQLLACEFLGDRTRLLRVAGIVTDHKLELLAEHTARCIDVCDGLLGTVLELTAEGGFAASHRAGHADRQVFCGRRADQDKACRSGKACQPYRPHVSLSS